MSCEKRALAEKAPPPLPGHNFHDKKTSGAWCGLIRRPPPPPPPGPLFLEPRGTQRDLEAVHGGCDLCREACLNFDLLATFFFNIQLETKVDFYNAMFSEKAK